MCDNGSTPSELFSIELEGSDEQFNLRMDAVWVTKKRSLIVVAAVLKGNAKSEKMSEAVYEAEGMGMNVTREEKKNASEEKENPGSIHDGDKIDGKEICAEPKDAYGYGQEMEELLDREEDGESTQIKGEETKAAEQESKERAKKGNDTKAKFERQMIEPSALQNSPRSQKHLHEPHLPRDERGLRQPRSQVLREYYAIQPKEGQAETALGTDARLVPSSEGSLNLEYPW